MMNTKHFGRIMRERRENSYISLRALSDVVDMSEHALRNIELGDSDPKLSNVLKIAGALQIDMGMLNSCIPILIEI
jgi:transcriptional regulator with XRE-family HTH domain